MDQGVEALGSGRRCCLRPLSLSLSQTFSPHAAFNARASNSGAIYNLGLANARRFRPFLRDDLVHPNDQGHRVRARCLLQCVPRAHFCVPAFLCACV